MMPIPNPKPRPALLRPRHLFLALAAFVALVACGCATPYQTAGLVTGSIIAVGAQAPTHEVAQIYYLGVFDPEEQLPPLVYRVTVRGQSSYLNLTRFASGWVPAGVIDSLSSQLSLDANGTTPVGYEAGNTNLQAQLKIGRRLMLFGPEGFREAPANHRLVIVMGADPSKFFEAVDSALMDITSVSLERANTQVRQMMFEELLKVRNARENLRQFQIEVAEDIPKS